MIEIVNCEVCQLNTFKYKCPKCLKKTCSLVCSKDHKMKDECQGFIDNSSKYISSESFKDADTADNQNNLVQRDYYFLSKLSRNLHLLKQDGYYKNKKIIGNMKVRDERGINMIGKPSYVSRRGVKCLLLPKGMTRSHMNKSKWDKPLDGFVWSIEWEIIHKSNLWSHVSHRNQEQSILIDCMGKLVFEKCCEWFQISNLPEDFSNIVKCNRSNFIMGSNLKFFTKKFPSEIDLIRNSKELIELDSSKCIGELFKGSTVIEFPTILIVENIDDLMKNGYKIVSDDCINVNSQQFENLSSSDESSLNENPKEKSSKVVNNKCENDDSEDDYEPGISLDFLAD